MSDFLTNLVIRSFSRTPSFQPMMAPAPSTAEPSEPEQQQSPEPPVTTAQPPVHHTDRTDQVEVTEPTPRITLENPKISELPESEPAEKTVAPSALKGTTTRKSEPPIVEQIIEQITEQVIERPAVTMRNNQQITKQAFTTHAITNRAITNQAITKREITNQNITNQQITNQAIANQHINNQKIANQQVSNHEITNQDITNQDITNQDITNQDISNQNINNSFTTLVPKPTAQPLPSVTTKTRPSRPAVKPPVEPEPAALPPETVINVAIGRIEVRATPAATPRRERQPAPKVMTLDDYVQQRSRGAK
jgi:hypothetical protein